jgi:hypothetical protein
LSEATTEPVVGEIVRVLSLLATLLTDPLPVPQAEPMADTTPAASTWRHCAEPLPRPEMTSDVVEAVPLTESWVVEALPRVVRPVTFSVEVAVMAPPKNAVPE